MHSVCRSDRSRDRVTKGLGVLRVVNSVSRKFFGKLFEIFPGEGILLFAPSREGQENLGGGREILDVVRVFLHLRQAEWLIARDSAEPEKETGRRRKRAD